MTLMEFQTLVEQNASWFRGVQPETPMSLQAAEQTVGLSLPPSLKWLLSQWGYSSACGVGSLDDAVQATLRCRQALHLPPRYLILNDLGDAGVVFLDTATADIRGECKVYWTGAHNLARLAEGQDIDNDCDVFDDYPAWVLFRLTEAQGENL